MFVLVTEDRKGAVTFQSGHIGNHRSIITFETENVAKDVQAHINNPSLVIISKNESTQLFPGRGHIMVGSLDEYKAL